MNSRRHFLRLTASAVALPAVSRLAHADIWPSRSVRLVVGFPPGFATDIVGRIMADALTARLGQQFVVDNKPGAGSNIGADVVVKAPPDGYTLLAMTVTNSVNETLYTNLDFDFVRDITPVAGTIRSANVLAINPSVPAGSVPEFIAHAKANPGRINYASAGYGSAPNMAAELFKMMTGVDLVHVPYKTSFVPDLLSGQVQCAFTPIPLSIGFIRAGKLRAIGVTSKGPSDALPEVPPIAQFVPGYEASIWHGIAAPKKIAAEIIAELNREINAVLADPVIKAKLANLGAEPMAMTPAEIAAFLREEVDKWAKVVKFAGIKPV